MSSNKENLNELNSISLSEDFVEETDLNNVQGTRCFIYFNSLLYKRENFPSSGSIAKYTCESESDNAHFDMCSLSTLDISKNNISLQIYGSKNNSDVFYVQLDVNYDFQKEDIIEFDLYAAL